MIYAGAKVDAQTAVGDLNTIRRNIERCIAADHVEDIQIFQHRLAFNCYVEHACAHGLPVQLGHF